ncbi:hypothetical protein [Methylobacterium komagatae]
MARLDVTDDLYDEDFIDPFVVIPGLVQINAYGLAEAIRQGVQVTGSVQAATGHDLIQFGEGDMTGGVIKVFTLYRLTAGNAQVAADRIVWGNTLYTVMNVLDYSNYAGGQGHVEALAQLTSVNPSTLPPPSDAGYLG